MGLGGVQGGGAGRAPISAAQTGTPALVALMMVAEGWATDMDALALLLAATFNAGTVLAIAALGLLINERAGIVNLGAEGMMLVAAIAGFATGAHRQRLAGLRAAAWRGALAGRGLRRAGHLAQHQPVRHRPGAEPVRHRFSAFAGIGYAGEALRAPHFEIPGPGGHSLSARRCSPASDGVLRGAADRRLAWFLYRSRAGLVLRSVGESPNRRMRWATRCGASACWRWWWAARCAAGRRLPSR